MSDPLADLAKWRRNSGIPDPGHIWGRPDSNTDSAHWYEGMPNAPQYHAAYDPSQAMLPGYDNYIKNNSQGYDAFKGMALRNGSSPWANLARTQQGEQAQDQTNAAVASNNSGTENALDQLSMRGGLTSGARERAVENGQNSLTGAKQGIARTEGQNNLQIGMNDEQNRISELGQLPGMENAREGQRLGVQQFDMSNAIGAGKDRNAFDQNAYNQQMTAWAAGKQAEATAASGGGGKK